MITTIPKPSTLNSLVFAPKYFGNPCSFPPFTSFPSRLKFPHQTRLFQIQACSLVLPLLPFPINQVLVPSEAKTLHLYEARYIALLEESLFQKNKLFVHVVLDLVNFNSTSAEASFAPRYGCLVIIEKVKPLDIGALVLIRGVGRVNILELKQAQPYLRGEVTPLQDNISQGMTEINSKVLELKEALHNLNSLEMKLKAPGEALLQTPTRSSLVWAEKQLSLDCITGFIPPAVERVSFASFQPVSGSTQSELMNLQKEKLGAMDARDTLERLKKSMELARNNIAMVAAKLAIQSLEMG